MSTDRVRSSAEERPTVVVGRIGRPHGVRGEVTVELRTDEPERRFAAGSTLLTRAPGGAVVSAPGARAAGGPVVPAQVNVAGTRWHQDRLLVRFEEFADRTAVERARGTWLEVEIAPDERPEDPEEFYDHQLVGLRVEDTAGVVRGEVAGIEHTGAQDLLHIRVPDRGEVLFPFVGALVPEVDLEGGRIVVDDRPGLLDSEG